ncbi:hypothetical protein DER45DRAFT_379705 [Fusarium avenaceum]|nr:hypothetical protein DER45DRAFT_379705 [Fusarium avenaceum]
MHVCISNCPRGITIRSVYYLILYPTFIIRLPLSPFPFLFTFLVLVPLHLLCPTLGFPCPVSLGAWCISSYSRFFLTDKSTASSLPHSIQFPIAPPLPSRRVPIFLSLSSLWNRLLCSPPPTRSPFSEPQTS